MVETLILNRIKFNKKGIQKKLILQAKKSLNLTWSEFAKELGVSTRTLTNWSCEKLNMSFVSAEKISKLTDLKIPKGYSIVKWDEHLRKISASGGKSSFKKHGRVGGDEIYRKNKWKEWWIKNGRYQKVPNGFNSLLNIKKPKYNKFLAEYIGIMLGDGGIAKYSTTITLSSFEINYVNYILNLIDKLFGLTPKVYKKKNANAVDIVVQRKALVDFCQSIGLVQGNKVKHQVDIPSWIKENKSFSIECVRGLIDTDGCFYINSYYVNGKKYFYFKIAFKNSSLPLIKSVAEILASLGVKVRISKNLKDVRIEEKESVLKYIKEIGTHNDKHLQKIIKWKNSKNMLE